jgi:hypothetical protein
VAAYTADIIVDGIIRRKPDLIAFRPVLSSFTESLVSNKAFRTVVERAAQRAHEAVLSEGSQRFLLSLPDLSILVREALRNASPGLAAKIPRNLDTALGGLAEGQTASLLLTFSSAGKLLRWAWPLFFVVGVILYSLAIWLSPDRQRTMVQAGFGLAVAGLLLAAIVALNALAALWIHDAKELGLVRGLWRTYLNDLTRWAVLLMGLGVLISSGASSLLERMDPFARLPEYVRSAAVPPRTQPGRLVWASAVFLFGCLISAYPALVLSGAGVVIGVCIAYAGLRELFRIFVETLEKVEDPASVLPPRVRRVHGAISVGLLVLAVGGGWVLWHKPATLPVRAASPILACNGFPELCDRRIDQVVFAGAHNAMSNQEIPGWMFPHHQAAIPQMLRDGIRALLVDIHYGFSGGARIKTDMSMEPNAETIKGAIGVEGYAAAMRIRDRLVGVDENQRGLYFCHGFCELGAYPVVPVLREIRSFLVAHPDEVIIIVIEDTVTPDDLASAFEEAGLSSLVYRDNPGARWPTLRELIERDTRLLVFIESGRPGVTWLRPAFESFRETPYTFRKIEEFSCRSNRGGEAGQLFQINHWIDTTPTPRPSNAAIVNAYAFLLARAEQCASERHHPANVIAVDFYQTGDLFAVVNKLNGVAEPDHTTVESTSGSNGQ